MGRVQTEGDESQLLLRVEATIPSGVKRQFLALTDTCVQVNLFRTGLFPACEVRPAQNPISLVKDDVFRLDGGDRKVRMKLGI